MNQTIIFEEELTKNKEHQLKISNHFDFEKPGLNTIEIIWDGEHDCENKFIKIYKIVINDQYIAPHSVMITPIPNEYIKNLLSTDEGSILYKKQLLNPGHHHGWYGTYKFKFLLDKHQKQNILARFTPTLKLKTNFSICHNNLTKNITMILLIM